MKKGVPNPKSKEIADRLEAGEDVLDLTKEYGFASPNSVRYHHNLHYGDRKRPTYSSVGRAHLTEDEKDAMIAMVREVGSYTPVGKKFGVHPKTVRGHYISRYPDEYESVPRKYVRSFRRRVAQYLIDHPDETRASIARRFGMGERTTTLHIWVDEFPDLTPSPNPEPGPELDDTRSKKMYIRTDSPRSKELAELHAATDDPRKLAEELGIPLGTIQYHARVHNKANGSIGGTRRKWSRRTKEELDEMCRKVRRCGQFLSVAREYDMDPSSLSRHYYSRHPDEYEGDARRQYIKIFRHRIADYAIRHPEDTVFHINRQFGTRISVVTLQTWKKELEELRKTEDVKIDYLPIEQAIEEIEAEPTPVEVAPQPEPEPAPEPVEPEFAALVELIQEVVPQRTEAEILAFLRGEELSEPADEVETDWAAFWMADEMV